MHLVSIIAVLVFAMPNGWVESTNLLLNPYLICKKPRRLRGKYHEMCKNETFMMREISHGISMGFKECEYQFRNRRWNCTSSNGHHMKKILHKDTRETSFVSAITAAGITYAVTRACSMGDLVECSCDKNRIIQHRLQYDTHLVNNEYNIDLMMRQQQFSNENRQLKKRGYNKQQRRRQNNPHPHAHTTISTINTYLENVNVYRNVILPECDWQWGGCGDNVMFGFRKSKEFLDSRYRRRSDIRTLVKLHNNNAGRLAVKSLMRMECKCHGLSGSCTIKSCWMRMPPFREISNRLKEHFDGASKVIARNDGHSFMPEGLTIKPPTRHDLIYTEDSTDFCQFNAKSGSLGTIGRECNATSAGIDGCDLLCCNRGYDHKIIREKVSCRCTFKWCCDVSCSTCIEKREIFTCR